jgi:Holliday junction resolvasome RuvABC DNA-binding subunit
MRVVYLGPLVASPSVPETYGPLSGSKIARRVAVALMELGCTAQAADIAVEKSLAVNPADDFERLFRRALELLR